jgi:hypothetical protein
MPPFKEVLGREDGFKGLGGNSQAAQAKKAPFRAMRNGFIFWGCIKPRICGSARS